MAGRCIKAHGESGVAKPVFISRRSLLTLATSIVATLLAVGIATTWADAQTYGQIGEAWGSPGSGNGQFYSPAMFGVDPSDGSVYAGDVTPDGKHYRIQKLSGSGEFEASVEIPRIVEEKIVTLHGIAVDPTLHRLYLIEGCHLGRPAGGCKSFGSTFGSRRILVFSTEPHGTELVSVEGTETLPLPGGEETLYTPQTVAVDPSNHDLVILAETISGYTTIRRISSTGVAGARFVDTENVLRPVGEEANSIAVGPTGTTYTLTGGPNAAGAEHTRAWELSPDLSSLTKVPGFAEAAEDEGWAAGLLDPKSSPLLGGPEIAISPDGSTLYWKEGQPSTSTEAGEVLVRGYSLAESATKALYGGGERRCAITTSSAGLATTGEDLVIFDYGPGGESPPYGDKVLTFGPGGSGCPAPVAKLKIDGSEEATVTVQRGETVAFDASGSELLEASPSELDWSFGDGTEARVLGTPEEGGEPPIPAEMTTSHQYAEVGTYTVGLRMKLEGSAFGNPPPVERTVVVRGVSRPKFKLTVSDGGAGFGTVTSSPGSIECGSACEAEYEEGTVVTLTPVADPGSEFAGWGGACSGGGACEVTMSAARSVTASFAEAAKPRLALTVTPSGAGSGTVTSVPAGIDCGPACEAEYEEGETVTLSASSSAGSRFRGWAGGGCAGTGACEVTMGEAERVYADFSRVPQPRFTLTVGAEGGGAGTVLSAPVGIACGLVCEEEFEAGTFVTLTPTPAPGSEFTGWTGACSGGGACEVTMSAARSVGAGFEPAFAPAPLEEPPAGNGPSKPRPRPKPGIARCKKLKGRKRQRCIRHAHQGGR